MTQGDPKSYREYPICGQTLRRYEIAGSTLSETAYPPRLFIPQHIHGYVGYFCLVMQGGYTEYSKRYSTEFGATTLLYHVPGEVHSDKFHEERTRLFCVWLGLERLNHIPDKLKPARSTQLNSGPALHLAIKLYKEFRWMDAVSPLAIEGLMLEMLAHTVRDSQKSGRGSGPGWIKFARELIHARFNESLLVSDIAAAVGVHPVHLTRVFRECFGCGVGEYVRRLRVEFVCGELSGSDKSLAEIASAAGFCDQGHLSRTFKLSTGMTLTQYRSAFRSH